MDLTIVAEAKVEGVMKEQIEEVVEEEEEEKDLVDSITNFDFEYFAEVVTLPIKILFYYLVANFYYVNLL